ncbi:hypothetical protein AB0F81_44010, partial [Actinoplanes sp. NPDC024001]|uniref:hypothetical protein n=1 Tax=Actinoplanes sp. NPDC024001 TaxID=3154598 RepID=UPI0033DCF2A3
MTVYGSGGVDVRKPRPGGLHPVVLALVVTAAVIAVAAIAYWALRSPADAGQADRDHVHDHG